MLRTPALILLLAAPAAAQDLAADYAAAARAFAFPTLGDFGDWAEDVALVEILPGLEGRWVAASRLAGAGHVLDPALMAETCENHPLTLAAITPRSFELRWPTSDDGDSMAVRYDYLIGNSFHRSVPEADYAAYMGLDEMAAPPPGILAAWGMRGDVSLFHPAPDLLVLVAPRMAPEIFARCPA